MTVYLHDQLELDRCPHCGVDRPNLGRYAELQTQSHDNGYVRFWSVYACGRCGGAIIAAAENYVSPRMVEVYPGGPTVDEEIPERAREYLRQAMNSLSAPAGAVVLASSAVDAMLKAKGFKNGSLYSRIDKAASDHVITKDMALWAHEVRLEANDLRHSDEEAQLPSASDAKRSIEFTAALGQFMFVLPARVQRGLKAARSEPALEDVPEFVEPPELDEDDLPF